MKNKNVLKWKKLKLFALIFFLISQSLFILAYANNIIDLMGEHAKSSAEIIKNRIEIEEYKDIAKNKNKNVYYYKMQNFLKETKESTGAKYVYVERYIGDNQIEYIFDSEGDSLGDVESINDLSIYANKYSFSTGLKLYNKWGNIITGYSPITDNGKIIGLVGIDYSLEFIYSSFKSQINTIIYYIITFVIFSFFLLFALKKEKEQDLKKTSIIYEKSVKALAASISKKSDYTWEHSDRVEEFSGIIGKCLKLNEYEVEALKWAALLHDIGKIGIPESILDKPDKLTREEFDVIKLHTIYSADILSNIFKEEKHLIGSEMYENIIDVALHHHERCDGKGYPHQLKKEEIGLFARIVSVADAFEAMTGHRPYKKSLSYEDAAKELIDNSGTQFDKEIVDVFIDYLKKEGQITQY